MATIGRVHPSDKLTLGKVDALLVKEGIKRDANLDYICAMYDDEYNVIATGSAYSNTLRCFAVDSAHQGEGLLNEIITHLIDYQYQKGNTHLFVYTKISTAKFFADLGFYEIARVENKLVFLENKRDAFTGFIKELGDMASKEYTGAIVMNANPFTLGHQYLVEKASNECKTVYVFVVSEDSSLVPFKVRKTLVERGVAHLGNVVCLDSGPYIISNATFPSYFLKDEKDVIESHAMLDITVFAKIAHALNIKVRYVGEEPLSIVTSLYNRVMGERLPHEGIECKIVPRRSLNTGSAISASTVRGCLKSGDLDTLRSLVPTTTYDYFTSEEAKPVIENIKCSGCVIHY